jgi:hypothetical protein
MVLAGFVAPLRVAAAGVLTPADCSCGGAAPLARTGFAGPTSPEGEV